MKTWPSPLGAFVRDPRRRRLSASCAGAAGASRPPAPRVGVMHVGTDHNPPSLATLVAGLGDLGWFDGPPAQVMQQLIGDGKLVNGRMKQVQGEYDGQRIQLIWRNLDGKDQAAAQAQEFVRERVDLIVAFEDTSISAAQKATADPANRIPVVFLHPSDPVRDGLVDSLAHPGGNLTGAFGARDPVVQAARDLPADPARTAALAPAHARRSDRRRRDAAAPGRGARRRAKLGIELVEREASDAAGLEAAFQSVGPGSVDGAFILSPSLRLDFSGKILAARRRGEPSRPGPSPGNGSTRNRTTTARSSRSASTSRPSGPRPHRSSTAS